MVRQRRTSATTHSTRGGWFDSDNNSLGLQIKSGKMSCGVKVVSNGSFILKPSYIYWVSNYGFGWVYLSISSTIKHKQTLSVFHILKPISKQNKQTLIVLYFMLLGTLPIKYMMDSWEWHYDNWRCKLLFLMFFGFPLHFFPKLWFRYMLTFFYGVGNENLVIK